MCWHSSNLKTLSEIITRMWFLKKTEALSFWLIFHWFLFEGQTIKNLLQPFWMRQIETSESEGGEAFAVDFGFLDHSASFFNPLSVGFEICSSILSLPLKYKCAVRRKLFTKTSSVEHLLEWIRMRLVLDRKVCGKIENPFKYVPYSICTTDVSCCSVPNGQ